MFWFQINGGLTNTGHSVVFTVENTTRYHINVTGGPLSYKYQLHELHIHYGLQDNMGSEHVINEYVFPAEVNILKSIYIKKKTSTAGRNADFL